MFKVGDLVQIKIPTERSSPQDIWIVLGEGVSKTGSFTGFTRVQNIHNGYICQYNAAFLKHFKSDKN